MFSRLNPHRKYPIKRIITIPDTDFSGPHHIIPKHKSFSNPLHPSNPIIVLTLSRLSHIHILVILHIFLIAFLPTYLYHHPGYSPARIPRVLPNPFCTSHSLPISGFPTLACALLPPFFRHPLSAKITILSLSLSPLTRVYARTDVRIPPFLEPCAHRRRHACSQARSRVWGGRVNTIGAPAAGHTYDWRTRRRSFLARVHLRRDAPSVRACIIRDRDREE